MFRKTAVLSALVLATLGVTSTASAHSMIRPHQAKTLSLAKRIELQERIIRHDKWVMATAKVHKRRAVRWHMKQLAWTTKELRESRHLLWRASQPSLSSSVCMSCWDRVAYCESHGIWNLVTGNGFYGGLQWLPSTWRANGGTRYAYMPNDATREQQIAIASGMSLSHWPVCGAEYDG